MTQAARKMSNDRPDTATDNAPGRTRTCDLRFRRPLLCPAELPGQTVLMIVWRGIWGWIDVVGSTALSKLLTRNTIWAHERPAEARARTSQPAVTRPVRQDDTARSTTSARSTYSGTSMSLFSATSAEDGRWSASRAGDPRCEWQEAEVSRASGIARVTSRLLTPWTRRLASRRVAKRQIGRMATFFTNLPKKYLPRGLDGAYRRIEFGTALFTRP